MFHFLKSFLTHQYYQQPSINHSRKEIRKVAVIKLKDGRWIVTYYVKNSKGKLTPQREYFGRGREAKTKAQARDQQVKANRATATFVDSGVTFNQVALGYQTEKMVPVGGMSKTDQTATYYKLKEYILPFFGSRKALRINDELCRKYIKKRLEDGVKSVTVRREFQIIKAILNWGCAPGRRLIAHNPIKDFPLPKKDNEVIPPPTVEELKRIYAAASPHLKRFILLNLNTGARSGYSELLQIKWEYVDFHTKVVSVECAKKLREPEYRRIPLSDAFVETLKAWRVQDALERGIEVSRVSGPIIHYKGEPILRIKTAWEGAFKRAGIMRRLRPYDVRHFFATMMTEVAGLGVKNLSELLGNTPETAYGYYLHGATKEKRAAVESLVGVGAEVQGDGFGN